MRSSHRRLRAQLDHDLSQAIAGLGAVVVSWCVMVDAPLVI